MNDFDDDGQWYPGMIVAYVFLIFVLRLRKNPEKTQPGKLTLPGIEPGPAKWEATMLPLDYSAGRQIQIINILII